MLRKLFAAFVVPRIIAYVTRRMSGRGAAGGAGHGRRGRP